MVSNLAQGSVGELLNGTYRIESIVAKGGMGVVYVAQHVRLPRRFAVKILTKPNEGADTALARFKREGEIAASLRNPHIVEVFDYQVSESGQPYLVMELLEGEDLATRLKRQGALPVAAALRIIREIADALDVAHAAGVVHRDLKPANVFLCKVGGREDFVKVLDFGVSKLIDAATLTQDKVMVGTPLYMSPEQAVGSAELSPQSDIFSLGTISFEVLTGRRAFAAPEIPSILYQIVHGPTPLLAGRAPGLGPEVDRVFARVLAKRTQDRYTKATEFAEELARALDRPLEIHATPQPEPPTLALVKEAQAGASETEAGFAQTSVDPKTDSYQVTTQTPKPDLALVYSAERGGAPNETLAAQAALQTGAVFSPETRITPTGEDTGALPASGSYTDLLKPQRPLGLIVMGLVIFVGTIGLTVMLWPARTLVSPEDRASQIGASSATVSPAQLESGKVQGVGAASPSPVSPSAALAEASSQKAALPSDKSKNRAVKSAEADIHLPVTFRFRGAPRGAEIWIDKRQVKGETVSVPWQEKPRLVSVGAPGYRTKQIPVSSTSDQEIDATLEARTEKPKARASSSAPPRQMEKAPSPKLLAPKPQTDKPPAVEL